MGTSAASAAAAGPGVGPVDFGDMNVVIFMTD